MATQSTNHASGTGASGLRTILQAITGPWTMANLWAWVKLIGLILVIRWAWFEPYKIPSGSMEPTLIGRPGFLQGDRVFVNKYFYGVRYPFMNKRIFEYNKPERWDIVVFKAAHENPEHKTLIKRIVGLPGEHVLIKHGTLYINGEPVEPPGELKEVLHYSTYILPVGEYILKVASGEYPMPPVNPEHENGRLFYQDIRMLRERIAAANAPSIPIEEILGWLDDCHPVTFTIAEEWFERARGVRIQPFRYAIVDEPQYTQIPEGHYFMLGDNSPNSVDGRAFGWVPGENFVGRTFCVWWPRAHWKDFTGFSATWWGRMLLWGLVPAVLLTAYVVHGVAQIVRLPKDAAGAALRAGERLLIDCRVYGLRWPFVSARMTRGRRPRKGEWVLFRDSHGGHYLGCISGLPGDRAPGKGKKSGEIRPGFVAIETDGDDGADVCATVPDTSLVGRATWVCWPPARIRAVASADIERAG